MEDLSQTDPTTRTHSEQLEGKRLDNDRFAGWQAYGPLTFERWLLSLKANPRLLQLEVKTRHNVARYKIALSRWQEAGYPHPGEWPDKDTSRLDVSAYGLQWVEKWCM